MGTLALLAFFGAPVSAATVFYPVVRVKTNPQEPILNYDGTLNNKRYGIVKDDPSHALSNSQKLSAALAEASSKGYRNISILSGTYYLDGSNPSYLVASESAVLVPSNVTLNLNGSTFIQVPNSEIQYTLFGVFSASNVVIKNGTLVGDKDSHTYKHNSIAPANTLEWGFGVELRAASNVTLDNLEIYNMTGDAVMLSGETDFLSNGGAICRNITIVNSKLHDCRRQGISVIGASNVTIDNNHIYNINGTLPKAGIDLEGELDWPVEFINITNNKITQTGESKLAVDVHAHSRQVTIRDNTVKGFIGVVYGDKIMITRNTVTDGGIVSKDTPEPKNLVIAENRLGNANIEVALLPWAEIRSNYVKNGAIYITYANGAIYDNTIVNTGTQRDFAIIAYADADAGGMFKVFALNNTTLGSFSTPIAKSGPEHIALSVDRNEMNSYIWRCINYGFDSLGLYRYVNG
jgi:hypothetical protein